MITVWGGKTTELLFIILSEPSPLRERGEMKKGQKIEGTLRQTTECKTRSKDGAGGKSQLSTVEGLINGSIYLRHPWSSREALPVLRSFHHKERMKPSAHAPWTDKDDLFHPFWFCSLYFIFWFFPSHFFLSFLRLGSIRLKAGGQ